MKQILPRMDLLNIFHQEWFIEHFVSRCDLSNIFDLEVIY